jgi:threonine dehydrogenase-like Zn-dependent dehydrogenase
LKAIIVKPGEKNSAELADIQAPDVKSEEFLIKTIRVGIDGTDREINQALYGSAPNGSNFLVLGHEALGRIVEIGSDVKNNSQNLNIGDLVVPMVRRPDDCDFCKKKFQDLCIKGDYIEKGIKNGHGFLREFFTDVPDYLIKIPKEIENIAVLLEPLSIVEKGIRNAWEAQKRMPWQPKNTLVLGLGAIGILAGLVLKLLGTNVYIFSMEETSDAKVDIVKKAGINYISAREKDIFDIPSVINGNIDFILEATGNSSIALKAMSLIGYNGILCLTSVTGGNNKVTICADCLNLDLVLGNKVIMGSVNANKIDFKKGVEHLIHYNQKFPGLLDKLISHKYNITEYRKTLENFKGLKAIIEFEN